MQAIPYYKWKIKRLDSCIDVTSIFKYKHSIPLSLSQVLILDYKLKNKNTTFVLANKEPKSLENKHKF